jgi:hypothetical protein
LAKGIVLFDSYVTAALTAFSHGFITRRNLLTVVASAREELARVQFKDAAMKAAREREYRDAAAAVELVLSQMDADAAKAKPAAGK